ncbi:MAG: hypothetical protein WBW48_00910 [Anaerolineae bacterium]
MEELRRRLEQRTAQLSALREISRLIADDEAIIAGHRHRDRRGQV